MVTLFVKPMLCMCKPKLEGGFGRGAQVADKDASRPIRVLGATLVEELFYRFGGVKHDGRFVEELEVDDVTYVRVMSARDTSERGRTHRMSSSRRRTRAAGTRTERGAGSRL